MQHLAAGPGSPFRREAVNGLNIVDELEAVFSLIPRTGKESSATATHSSGVPPTKRSDDGRGLADGSGETGVPAAAHRLRAAPILFGIDKFFNWSVEWPTYLASWVNDIAPGSAQSSCTSSGREIVAGLTVAFLPRIGDPLVAAWLAGIIVNLLTVDAPRYYDIALRDFGLLLGALALTRLTWAAYAEQRSTTTVGAAAPPSQRAVRV